MDHKVKRGAADVGNVTEYSRCLQMSDKKVASEEITEWETRQFVIQETREFKILKFKGSITDKRNDIVLQFS
jgi:hypothetical protein